MALILYQGNGDTGVPTDDASNTPVLVGKKFVGLANQGATCYLNGLIQTLFMTPEFRKAIFSWNYNQEKDGSEVFCIPLQLQRLFGRLQLCKSRSVDTVPLTKSFGWEGSEVFQQQDVQELTRVLFDALEETFKGTDAETVIDDLFAGELIDYIRCIDVDYQSERIDKFLDFSLAIVPFGETKAMKSLAECIEMFLRPEILDGDNKYFCEKYDKKVDAIKGLKFGRLPQIMSVQLKRFVYDFSGDYVVQKKLNEQVKFPMVLDMNKYLAKKSSTAADGTIVEIVNDDFEAFLHEQMNKLKNGNANKDDGGQNPENVLQDIDIDVTQDPDVPDELIPQYIKDLVAVEEEKRIARQKEEEELRNRLRIRIHWQGKEQYIFVKRNFTVKEALETVWQELNVGKHFARQRMIKSSAAGEGEGVTPETSPTDAAEDAKSGASEGGSSDDDDIEPIPMNVDLIRLRDFNHITKLRTTTYDASAEKRLSDLYFSEYKHYIIETRETHEAWEEYYQDGLSILLEEFDATSLTFKEPRTVRMPKGATLGDFKAKIANMISFDIKNALISKIVALAYNDGRQDVLAVDSLRLREDYTVYEGAKLVVEDFTVDPDSKQSLAFQTFMNVKNKIQISYNLPPEKTFDHTMMVDGRWKIRQLRQQVADAVGLPIDECRMFKMNNKGNEFKDSDVTVSNAGVYAHMYLFVKRGKPTPPLHFSVSLFKYTARDYVPGATELPAGNPLDYAQAVASGDVEVVEGAVDVDPWHTAIDDDAYPSSASGSRAAPGINPYQQKIPSDYHKHTLTSITEVVSSDHTNVDQIIDDDDFPPLSSIVLDDVDLNDVDDLARRGGASRNDEANDADDADDVASNQCLADIDKDQDMMMEDVDDELPVVDPCDLSEDELLLQEALLVTASYPVNEDNNTHTATATLSRGTSDDSQAVALARPILTVERSISREQSSDSAPIRSRSHSQQQPPDALASPSRDPKESAFHTPKTNGKVATKASEAEDVRDPPRPPKSLMAHLSAELDQATKLQQEECAKNTFTNSYTHEASKKLAPLRLATDDLDGTIKKYPTVVSTPPHYRTPRNDFDYDGDDVMAAVAAIDAAVERANMEALQASGNGQSSDGDVSNTADVSPVPAEEISDFGERMVKNLIVPEQFEEYTELESLYVAAGTQIGDFRRQVHTALQQQGLIDPSVTIQHIRVREKIGNCPAKILRDGKTMQESNIYLNDHKAFCVEILAEAETLPEDDYGDVIVQVQKWHRQSWSLSEKIDVILPGGTAVRDIASGLGKLFQIPFAHLRLLVIPRDTSLMLSDLMLPTPAYSRSWFDPRYERRLLRQMLSDMRVIEGDLLLLQDVSEPLMELTDADKRSLALVQAAQNNPSSLYADGTYSYPSSNKVPSWVSNDASSPAYKYPTVRYATTAATSTGTGTSTSSGSRGIRIKTQKDRQREADQGSSTASLTAGNASPIDYITGDDGVVVHSNSVQVGTEDDFFLTGGDSGYLSSGRYGDDMEFMRQGGPALFSDLD
eukprot:gene9379-6720_t